MSDSHKETSSTSLLPLILASAACLQWLVVRALHVHLPEPWVPLLPGVAIIGAAFLVTWAAEAAEMDLPQSLSIAIVALIAVLPEYAVDLYFAWSAGKDPKYMSYAAANMTGANRLLIGIGWPAVLFAGWWAKGHSEIHLTKRNSLELVTLLIATLYSFILPLKATISLMDTVVFFALFAAYGYLSSKASVEAPHLVGTALMIADLPKVKRRTAVISVLVFAAGAIALAAEPFAEGILAMGRTWGVEEFLLVQWLAPLASEAPEFVIAMLFAVRGKAQVGMRALVSSKVNQWTMLIGALPVAYNLSAGHIMGMHLDERQVEEVLLTSAQSLFGMAILMNLNFAGKEAVALLVLFLIQMFFPQAAARYAFSAIYIVLALTLMVGQSSRRANLKQLIRDAFNA